MSKLSDVKYLFIEAANHYGTIHHLSKKRTMKLFQEQQVFEKLLANHEILHQLDIHDTYDYVEKIISEKSKTIMVYHGTNINFDEVDLEKSHNRRDFGRGFYCTLLPEQATNWAQRLKRRDSSETCFVYQYMFHSNDCLDIKSFDDANEEWLDFIKANRIEGGIQHSYDIVMGPVADDATMSTLQLYTSNMISKEEAIAQLRYAKLNNQISFHTTLALKYLDFVEKKEV